MRTRHIFLGTIIILTFLLSASALASMSAQSGNQKQNATQINVWYFDDGTAETFLQNQFDQFASSNGVTINRTKIDVNSFSTLFDKYFFNDSYRPDLIEVKSDWIPQFVAKNYIISVDSYVNETNTFVNSSLRALSYFQHGTTDFHVYAFPYSMDTMMGFANKRILTENNADVPNSNSIWSWSQWLKSVSLSNNQLNTTDPHYGFSFTDAPGSFDAMLYGMGGRLFTDLRVDRTHFGIDSNASLTALQFASDLVNARHLTPTVDLMGTSATRQLFEQGKVAMVFDYFSGLNSYLNSSEFKSNDNLVVFQIPQITNGTTGAPLSVDAFSVVSKATGDVLSKALDLGKFLSGAEVQQSLTTNYVKIPARVSALESVKNDTYYKPFLMGLSRAYQVPLSNFWFYAISNYADRIWVFLRGEPATASQAALGIEVFLDQVPLKDNTPLYAPSSYPDFFTSSITTSSKGSSTPGFEYFILIPVLLGLTKIRSHKLKNKRKF